MAEHDSIYPEMPSSPVLVCAPRASDRRRQMHSQMRPPRAPRKSARVVPCKSARAVCRLRPSCPHPRVSSPPPSGTFSRVPRARLLLVTRLVSSVPPDRPIVIV